MAESEEQLKSLLMRVKEESEKAVLKLMLRKKKKTKNMVYSPITSLQIEGEKVEAVADFTFLGSKITVDSDCTPEIKRHLLLERKAMTKLDSVLKSRDILLLTKLCIVKSVFFFSTHVWMWELDHKEGWALKNWCFQIVVLEKTLEESPLNSKEIKPVNSKGNQPWIFIERTDALAK